MSDKTGTTAKATEEASGIGATESTIAAPTVDWDDSEMRSTYANVVNASSTREEVTVFFGSNLTWNPAKASKFHVKLSDRIILNPHAAKRLWILLGVILNQYEKRFGKIEVDASAAAAQNGADRTD
ncbi:MAG: DUF3467 domain-containing protein [Hyphomicrobiales bacterium]